MKLLFITMMFISVMSLTAQSADLLQSTEEKNTKVALIAESAFEGEENVFPKLRALFKSGSNVTYDDVQGFYAGRCYDLKNRTEPQNSLLGIYEAENEQKIVEGGSPQWDVDHFDGFSAVQAQVGLSFIWDAFDKIQNYKGTIASAFVNTSDKSKSKVVLRKNGKYLILATIAGRSIKTNSPRIGNFRVRKGEIWAACHYTSSL